MKTSLTVAVLACPVAVLLSGCSHQKQSDEVIRPVRAVEISYEAPTEVHRYEGTIRSRYEVDEAFRVGGKVVQRLVEIGQTVREGQILAVLDGADYRLAEQAAQQHLSAARAQAEQADSDRRRLEALKTDGSVSVSDDEHAHSSAVTTQASAEAAERQYDLARNRLTYTVLRASQSGVVTALHFEVGQVVAEGQAVVSIANESEPEIVIDVPEAQVGFFENARFRALLAIAPEDTFEVTLRELSREAAKQTRTYRARMKPLIARKLPLGATATLVAERVMTDASAAAIPASAITQSNGKPALWVVRRAGTGPAGSVELVHVAVRGYRTDQVLVSGLRGGELVVVAGVQKMSQGLHVALTATAPSAVLEAAR